MGKKILGYVLIILAVVLAFGTLGTLGSLFRSFGTFVLGILGKVSTDETARALGAIVAQAIICVVIYFSWVYGRKWTSKKEAPTTTDVSKL